MGINSFEDWHEDWRFGVRTATAEQQRQPTVDNSATQEIETTKTTEPDVPVHFGDRGMPLIDAPGTRPQQPN